MMPENNTAMISRKVRKNEAYYFIRWSKIYPLNRYCISRYVPAMAGLYQLFYLEDKKDLRIFYMGRIWLGGLRAEIRLVSDPDSVLDPARRAVLTEKSVSSATQLLILKTIWLIFSMPLKLSCRPDKKQPATRAGSKASG